MAAIERVITHGTFELDGGSWEVDNNIWLVGDDSEVVVFDAAHHAAPIIDAVGGRKVVAVICTHGHNDHVTVAPELGTALDAPVLMHPGDAVLWRMTHPDKSFRAVSDGDAVRVGGTELRALHTPGHSLDRCAGMRQSWVPEQAPCSAETRCSLAGRVQPAARIPTSHDPAVDIRTARRITGRHRRAHRPRRQHHHRRRDRPLRGMGGPWALIPRARAECRS